MEQHRECRASEVMTIDGVTFCPDLLATRSGNGALRKKD